MLRPYREILRKPGALAFSATGVLARLPMSMVGIGIVLMVYELYGSYGLAGRVSAGYVIATSLASPQIARLVDRHGQARIVRPTIAMAVAGLAGLILVATVRADPAWLYVAAVVAGVPASSFGALVRARWSCALDDPRQLHTAFSLESALDEVVYVVGPVLATVLATSVAPTAGLLVAIVATVGGGYLFVSLHRTEPPIAARVIRAPGEVRPDRAAGVVRNRGMLVLAAVFVAIGAIFGATDVSTVAFTREQGSPGAAGFVLATFALGSMISGLGYGVRHWIMPLWQRFAISVAALAAGVSLFFLADRTLALALVMFATGFAIAPSLINGNGLVQSFVPASRLTEGLTWLGTSLGLGVSIGSSIAGVLIDRLGSQGGFFVVAGSGGLAAVATLLSLHTLRAGDRIVIDGPATLATAQAVAGR